MSKGLVGKRNQMPKSLTLHAFSLNASVKG